jgi:hypothetical protein
MAHGSKHRESRLPRFTSRVTGCGSEISPLPGKKRIPIGFSSFHQSKSEEAVLRAGLEDAGDFTWTGDDLDSREILKA